jgi:tRNA G18 (ribose-2'-O)-methylase SpoU
MPVMRLEDEGDARLDAYLRLTDAQLRNRLEPERGIVICESEIAVRQALESGIEPLSMLVSERRLGALGDLVSLVGDVPVYVLPDEAAERLTGYRLHRGVLCALRRPKPMAPEDVVRDARRVAVLVDLVDVANVGAIFRSAAALGVDAVLVSESCADPWCRRAVRVSMGTVFRVPWARLAGDTTAEGMSWLRERGFACAAFALRPDAMELGDPALAAKERLAMVFGNEASGLEPEVISACDLSVRIPMSREVDSLNVAASSAVAFWELCARRSTRP